MVKQVGVNIRGGRRCLTPFAWGRRCLSPFGDFHKKAVLKACLGTEVPVPSVPNTCMIRKDKVAQYLNIAERRIRCIIQ